MARRNNEYRAEIIVEGNNLNKPTTEGVVKRKVPILNDI